MIEVVLIVLTPTRATEYVKLPQVPREGERITLSRYLSASYRFRKDKMVVTRVEYEVTVDAHSNSLEAIFVYLEEVPE